MKRTILSILFILFSSSSWAQKDAAGAKDHPLISRYPDTHIVSSKSSEFDEFLIATGPITREIFAQQGRSSLPPVTRHEGKTLSLNYKANRNDISALAVYRNFEKAFNKNGFSKIFSCRSDQECGHKFVTQLYWYGDASKQGRYRYLDAPNLHGQRSKYFFWSGKVQSKNALFLISLLVAQDKAGNFPVKVALDINEVETLDDDKIVINLAAMEDAIAHSGKAVLDGILFDTDTAVLKEESKEVIKIIAEYLNKHPQNTFYVVGHTDNQGATDYNLKLSTSRAETVKNALIQAYGISPKRLSASGVGPYSPVTANLTDEGRALNRRVELVTQGKL